MDVFVLFSTLCENHNNGRYMDPGSVQFVWCERGRDVADAVGARMAMTTPSTRLVRSSIFIQHVLDDYSNGTVVTVGLYGENVISVWHLPSTDNELNRQELIRKWDSEHELFLRRYQNIKKENLLQMAEF